MFVSLAVENMLLGMEKEVWEIADTSHDIVATRGQWELLGINKAKPKMSVGSSLFDQIMFYVSPEILEGISIPWTSIMGSLASCPKTRKALGTITFILLLS